ncbi:MAG: hypothetical protein ACLR23_02390 [Clostridia bacterium]
MIWVSATRRPKVNRVDEWGVVYESIGESFGEPKVFPLEGKETLDGYTFPDFSEDWRYEAMRKTIAENVEEKYVLGMLPNGLFRR